MLPRPPFAPRCCVGERHEGRRLRRRRGGAAVDVPAGAVRVGVERRVDEHAAVDGRVPGDVRHAAMVAGDAGGDDVLPARARVDLARATAGGDRTPRLVPHGLGAAALGRGPVRRVLSAGFGSYGTLLVGFQVQSSWSWVPPTAVTYGLDAGQPTVGFGNVPVSRCCLDVPVVPSSPEEAKKVSPLAMPFL